MKSCYKEKESIISSSNSNIKNLIYLHGFNSSPYSPKALAVKNYLSTHFEACSFLAPDIPPYPKEAYNCVSQLLSSVNPKESLVIASSMGAFLLSACEDFFSAPSCLINPAVSLKERFKEYIGSHQNPYTQKEFELKPEHFQELTQMEREKSIHPKMHLVLLKKGDEVLDCNLAIAKYQGAEIRLDEGGDHSFSDFSDRLPEIFSWLYSKAHL